MIKIRELKKNFLQQEVLRGVRLDIPKNKITTIVGRSGCGKTVLLKHMIGLLKPDSGKLWVNDVDITSLNSRKLNELRNKFGMLFQGAALLDSMTVFENVAFPLEEKTRACTP